MIVLQFSISDKWMFLRLTHVPILVLNDRKPNEKDSVCVFDMLLIGYINWADYVFHY